MFPRQDVTQLPCQVAHITTGWSDLEQVAVSSADPAQLLLRAPHHIAMFSLGSPANGACRLYWQPHRRLTAACWLPGGGGSQVTSEPSSRMVFAVGDSASTVRLAHAPPEKSSDTRDIAGYGDAETELASTTIVVDRDALIESCCAQLTSVTRASSSSSSWYIREVLPIARAGDFLLAQRASASTTPAGAEVREPGSARPSIASLGSPCSADVWVLSAERQSCWAASLSCAAGRVDEVPTLMPVEPTSCTSTTLTPQFAMCSSQAITVCAGPHLTPAASFLIGTDTTASAAASSEVLRLFSEEDAGCGSSYTALVRQQRGPQSSVWLAEWDARFSRCPTWWAPLVERADGTDLSSWHCYAAPLDQRRTYAVAALPPQSSTTNTRASLLTVAGAAAGSVDGQSTDAAERRCVSVKPCEYDISHLFTSHEEASDSGAAEAEGPAPSHPAHARADNGVCALQDRCTPASFIGGMSYVNGVLQFLHFAD